MIPAIQSPCGSNCSFVTEFYSPRVTCRQSVHNRTEEVLRLFPTYYSAGWDQDPASSTCHAGLAPGWWWSPADPSTNLQSTTLDCSNHYYPGDFSLSIFKPFATPSKRNNLTNSREVTTSVSRLSATTAASELTSTAARPLSSSSTISARYDYVDLSDSLISWVRDNRLTCTPQRTHFTVATTYTNGVRDLKINSHNPVDLREVWSFAELEFAYGKDAQIKNSDVSNNWAVYGHFAIIDALVDSISGQFTSGHSLSTWLGVYAGCPGSEINADDCINYNSRVKSYTDPRQPRPSRTFHVEPMISVADFRLEPNHTIILDTAFNLDRYNDNDTDPRLSITEDLINEALQNITIAASFALPIGSQSVNTSTLNMQPTFRFKPRMLLVLPYTLSLLAALLMICAATWAIQINGSAVEDNAFIQTFTCAVGSSDAVRNMALQYRSSRDITVAQEFEKLEIIFGFVNDGVTRPTESDLRKRVGFGLNEEIAM